MLENTKIALYKALYIEALYKALHKALYTEALYKALRIKTIQSSALGPRYIPNTRASTKYTPYIYLGSYLIFYPSFLISSLPRGILE